MASSSSSKAIATMDEHLPEDVMLQILYGLPVDTLIRFSCTSKRWRSIILDPKFAKLHYKLSCQRNTLTRRLLVSMPSQEQSLDVQTPDSPVRRLTFPFKLPGSSISLLGSCNGMVLITPNLLYPSNDGDYYIWNPSTAKVMKLSTQGFDASSQQPFTRSDTPFSVGFGYLSATNEYKVIRARSVITGRSFMPLQIFSSAANSWKMINRRSYLDWVHRIRGVLYNESVHWVRYFEYEDSEDVNDYGKQIVAFDLANEEFRVMDLPFIDDAERGTPMPRGIPSPIEFNIDVSGGCLCVSAFLEGRYQDTFQFWVMKEYGVCESWTKLYQVYHRVDDHLVERPVFHTESSMIVWSYRLEHSKVKGEPDDLVSNSVVLLHKDVAGFSGEYMVEGGDSDMVHYEETLLWLNDHLDV